MTTVHVYILIFPNQIIPVILFRRTDQYDIKARFPLPELTARVNGRAVSTSRVDGPFRLCFNHLYLYYMNQHPLIFIIYEPPQLATDLRLGEKYHLLTSQCKVIGFSWMPFVPQCYYHAIICQRDVIFVH